MNNKIVTIYKLYVGHKINLGYFVDRDENTNIIKTGYMVGGIEVDMTEKEYRALQKKMWEVLGEDDAGWKSEDWEELEDYVKEKLILQLAGVEKTYDE